MLPDGTLFGLLTMTGLEENLENNLKVSENDETTYDKAKTYWSNVDSNLSGMLGGLPEVGFIGKFIISDRSYLVLVVNVSTVTNELTFRHSSFIRFHQASV